MTDRINFSDQFGSIKWEGDTCQLIFKRILGHPVEKVWAAITEPDRIAEWLSPNHPEKTTTIELRPDGVVQLQFMMALIPGRIAALQDGELLEISFEGGSLIRWELEKTGYQSCNLTFTACFTEQQPLPAFLREAMVGWHGYLDFMAIVLDGNAIPPFKVTAWQMVAKELFDKYQAHDPLPE